MRTSRVDALLGFASHEHGALHRLHILSDVPSLAMNQRAPTMYAPVQLTLDDDTLGPRKPAVWTATSSLLHFLPLPSRSCHYILKCNYNTARVLQHYLWGLMNSSPQILYLQLVV